MFSSADKAILFWFNQHYIPNSIPFLQFLSDSSTYLSISILFILLLISIIRKSKEMLRKFFILSIVLALSGITTYVIKSNFNRERPFYMHPEIVKRSTGGESSFPSGHTTEAFALAVGFTMLFRKKKVLAVALFIWAFMIGYSRIALGVHYPSDVLAGMVFGTLLGMGVPWLSRLITSINYRSHP